MKSSFSLLLLLLLTVACAKSNEFATPPDTTTVTSSTLTSYTYDSCSLQGSINPKVNILILIDNSTSTTLLSSSMKKAIVDSIYFASTKFDYRIFVAPLITPEGGESLSAYPAFSGTPTGSTVIPHVASSQIDSLTFKNPAFGSAENGFSRTKQVIDYNVANGHFRTGAHTFTVLISNGDDNEVAYNPNSNVNMFEQKLNDLKATKASIDPTGQKQFRLVSLVAQSYCKVGYVIGRQYREMSKRLYALSGDTTQTNFFPDTFDLCSGNFPNVFNQINNSIDLIPEQLTYAHWPMSDEIKAKVIANQINLANLSVSAYSKESATRTLLSQGVDYSYNTAFSGSLLASGHVSDLVHTGHALNLLTPKARIKTPDCMSITAPEYEKYYGYIPVAINPLKESIQLTINGKNHVESATNGWQLLPTYQPSLNVLVAPTPSHITDMKAGYMIKLNGSAIYKDGASIQLTLKKSPNQ